MSKSLNDWANECWQIAEDHGFHDAGVNDAVPSWVANLHGEVSELWEAHRKGRLHEPCDKRIDMTCAEEELADIVIRALDCAVQLGIDVEDSVRRKCDYNRSRPWRHGGKVA